MCRWRDWPWDGEGPLLEVTGEGEGRIRVGVRMLVSAGGKMRMLPLIMRRVGRGETGEGHSFRMGVMRTVKRERGITVEKEDRVEAY